MSQAKVAVVIFPGTNSEEETQRLLCDVGLHADIVHWSLSDRLVSYDAFVLPGGFAYEDRIRAGAIAAHDRAMDGVIEGAQAGKLVLGICNGAQVLLEAGLVPGTGSLRRPTAAFTKNAQRTFVCRHVYVKLVIEPQRCAITAALEPGTILPAWAAHGEGRLAASPERLDEVVRGNHLAFVYADATGATGDGTVPNGSALGCAALVNRAGNVLAIMPHPERDAWNFNHLGRSVGVDPLSPSGGARLFESFAAALR